MSIAASATEPWTFAHTTRSGKTRYTRRVGRRASDASSQMSPVKSGSAKTCARIVNVQGAARSTGKKTRRIERGPAPSVRAATAAIAKAPIANTATTTASSPWPPSAYEP